MKKIRILSAAMGLIMAGNTIGAKFISAEAASKRPVGIQYTVVAVNAEGDCILNNNCLVTREELQLYSDEMPDLKYGDIIDIVYEAIEPGSPGHFVFDENSVIAYMGSVDEYGITYTGEREVKVIDIQDGILFLLETSRNIVHEYAISDYKALGFETEFDIDDLVVGDFAIFIIESGWGYALLHPYELIDRKLIADEQKYKVHGEVVLAVNDDEVLLSNNCELKQDTFRTYSGEEFDLQCGDAVYVDYEGVMESSPGQFSNIKKVEYLGKAKDYYQEQVKELTVIEINGFSPIWKDADGVVYNTWWDGYGMVKEVRPSSTYQYDVSPVDFSIGDSALCVIECNRYKGYLTRIILEKTYEAEYVPGDVTGEGDVNLMDVISINRHLMIAERLTPAAKKAADLNGDGKVTPAESLQILRYVVKLEDSLV